MFKVLRENNEKKALFEVLKTILSKYATDLDIVVADEANYYLNTRQMMKNKKPLFFGAVNVKKNYVSFHLMPVYVEPKLLESLSDSLKKRMQGKSCFNFKLIDSALMSELEALTESGYQYYVSEGYIGRET